MNTLYIERLIDIPAGIAWDVIADVERYADYAPNLSSAHKLTTVGETDSPGRRCYDTQNRGWNETCVLWEDGRRYSFLVDTSDYPYPFTYVKGTWGVEPRADGTLVYMQFDYVPAAPKIGRWLVNRWVKAQFGKIVEELMDNWEAEMKARVAAQAST